MERRQRGRRQYVTVRGTKSHAERVKRRVMEDRDLRAVGLKGVAAQATELRTLLKEFQAEHAGQWSASHARRTRQLLTWVVEKSGFHRVADVTLASVQARRAKMPATMSNRTRNMHWGALKTALAWAEGGGKVERNPLAGLRALPTKGRHRARVRHALTPEKARELVAAARARDEQRPREVPQSPLLETLLWTGLRRSEAVRLLWRDVGGGVVQVRPESSKAGTGRTVPVPEWLRTRLRDLRQRQARWTGRLARDTNHVVLGAKGRPHNETSVSFPRLLAAWLKASGVERTHGDGVIDWHSFRRTYATWLALAGVDVREAQRLLGHATIAMTVDVYTASERLDVSGSADALPGLERRGADAGEGSA